MLCEIFGMLKISSIRPVLLPEREQWLVNSRIRPHDNGSRPLLYGTLAPGSLSILFPSLILDQPALPAGDDRFTYADATSLESPTGVKTDVPGAPTAPTVSLAALILQRNTAVRGMPSVDRKLTLNRSMR
jgi:hypothetical protein